MSYNLRIANWKNDKDALSIIRRKVFIQEQRVPEDMEWDEYDESSAHILVTDNYSTPIACGRMKADGHIGRMAVIKGQRNNGIGTAILKSLLTIANDQKLEKVYLHAQTIAIPFYEKQNFEICSEEFLDAGIPHKTMQLVLSK